MDILKEYTNFCKEKGIEFENIQDIISPDDSTLFCSAGMQRFKKDFVRNRQGTIATNQLCLRVDDISVLGDGIHFGVFNMLGLFSFRDWSIEKAIKFWLEFMQRIGLEVTEAHIHPNKKEWKAFYKDIPVVLDEECKWSDGKVGGYCTEFYHKDIEIGNIVNPLGNCIDAGFGLERLDKIVNNTKSKSRLEIITETANAIISAGYNPSNKKQGYVLRRLLRELRDSDVNIKYLSEERERHKKVIKEYNKLKLKHPNQTKEWWWETHGLDLRKL